MAKTLLEKVKETSTGKRLPATPDPELVDVALAYLRGEVSARQVGIALGWSHSNTAQRVAAVLCKAVRSGAITIAKATGATP